MTFKELNLNESMLEALSYMNFEKATPIQEKAIPIILENKDLIACAQTGTGKRQEKRRRSSRRLIGPAALG